MILFVTKSEMVGITGRNYWGYTNPAFGITWINCAIPFQWWPWLHTQLVRYIVGREFKKLSRGAGL